MMTAPLRFVGSVKMGLSLAFGLNPSGTTFDERWNFFYVCLAICMGGLGSYTASLFLEVLLQKRHRFLLSSESHLGMSYFIARPMTRLSVFAAALSFGVSSVWVNHFTSMAAVDYGEEMKFNFWYTAASMVGVVIGTYVAFLLICHGPTGELPDKSPTMAKLLAAGGNMKELTRVSNGERLPVSLFTEFKVFCLRWRCAWAALSLALAIGTAHYVGVLSARMNKGHMVINHVVVLVSVLIVLLASFFILFGMFRLQGGRYRFINAFIAAAGIASVHYFGYLAALRFIKEDDSHPMNIDGTGELLIAPKRSVVVVAVVFSLLRFVLMGIVGST